MENGNTIVPNVADDRVLVDPVDNIRMINRVVKSIGGQYAHFWKDPRSGEPYDLSNPFLQVTKLMLMVSELGEAMEGIRRGTMDEHLPMFTSLEVELADVFIRLFDFCNKYNIEIGQIIHSKHLYNMKRADHSDAARSSSGGKLF